jgi:hypothetical protein
MSSTEDGKEVGMPSSRSLTVLQTTKDEPTADANASVTPSVPSTVSKLSSTTLELPDAEATAVDEDITSMDTTSPIRWSWSSTCFQTAGKHLFATVVMSSYGFQFGSSTTP